jgi:hypothetical protein
METISISANIEDGIIILSFSSGEKVRVITSGDVDLSEYVKILTGFIDKKPKLSFATYQTVNSKLNLIQHTIDNITKSFNESVIDVEEAEEASGDMSCPD